MQNLPFGVVPPRGQQRELSRRRGDRRSGARSRRAARARRARGRGGRGAGACAQPTLNEFMAQGPTRAGALRAALSGRCARARRSPRGCRALLVPQAAAQYRLAGATSGITPTSTPRSITRPRSDGCSGPTIRCCPTTSGCRSPTTAAPHRSRVRPADFRAPARTGAGRRAPQRPVLAPDAAPRLRARSRCVRRPRQCARRRPSRSPRPSSTCSVCACSMTGRRATCRPGSTSRSGPFLGKNFATTISPWMVTLEALAPFRTPWLAPRRGAGATRLSRCIRTLRAAGAHRHPARGLAAERAHARRRAAAAAPVAQPRSATPSGPWRRC